MELTRKERAEGPEKFPLHSPSVTSTMRNARFPPTSRYREFSQSGECVHSALEESSTVNLDTWNILSRTVDHAPIDYLLARSPLSNLSRDRDTSFHCLAYAADKPIASAVDVNAFGCSNYSVCVHVRFIH